jgi:hypothetical protein
MTAHPIPPATIRPRSGRGAAACQGARRRNRPRRYPVLDAVEHAFAQLAADPDTPRVRTVEGRLPLSVVRSILADPATPGPEADVIWRTLIGRARGDNARWLLAVVGCALPRIRSGIWHATRNRAVDRDEAAQAALAAFTEAVMTLEPLPYVEVLDELVRHARNAAQRVADHVKRDRLTLRPLPSSMPPPAPAGHVDFVLADLVHEGVITRDEADLIGRHRIEGTSIRRIAAAQGTYPMRLCRVLKDAETRVITALTEDAAGGPESPNGHRPV